MSRACRNRSRQKPYQSISQIIEHVFLVCSISVYQAVCRGTRQAVAVAAQSNHAPLLTHVREIVDQNYVANQVGGRPVQHRVHGTQQHRPRLVVEADDHIGGRQVVAIPVGLLAPVNYLSAFEYVVFDGAMQMDGGGEEEGGDHCTELHQNTAGSSLMNGSLNINATLCRPFCRNSSCALIARHCVLSGCVGGGVGGWRHCERQ